MWGIRESEDGQDRADALDGAPMGAARAFKDRVTNLLKDGIDPAFEAGECLVNLVPLDADVAAVVVHVRGIARYPKGIRDKRDGRFRFVQRVGRATTFPDQRAVRLSRSDIERREWVQRAWRSALAAVAFVALIVLVAVVDRVRLTGRLAETTAQLNETSARLAELTDDRAERIDAARMEAFVSALSDVADRMPIELQVLQEPETLQLGQVVLDLLKRSGWPVTKVQATQIWFPTTNGVHLQVASDSPVPPQAAVVAAALDGLGIGPTRVLVPERLPDPGTFRVFIGRRVRGGVR